MATTNKNFKVKNGLDVNGEINVSAVGGDEGGQINLEKPATGTTLSGNVSIDIYQNRIRIFDAAGTNKGAYIDLSAATDGVGSNLLAGGGAGITSIVEDTTPQLGGDLDAQGYDITNLNSLTFDTTPTSPGTAAGTIYWDDGDGVPKAILNANVTVGVNQELILKVKNATGTTITKGSVVYINGAQGQNPTIALANATTEGTSSKTFGFTAEAIVDGAEGFLIAEGIFRGANTDGLVEGDPIYLSTTAGQYTQTIPAEPAHSVFLGYVVKAHASAGEIIVKIQNGYELTELHGVTIANTAATNDILQLNSSGIWVNANLATAGIANLSGATFTGNLAGTNLALSGKDIFSNTGTGAPTFTTYSSGVRTVFYDNVGGTSVGYSRGIDAGVLWDSIPAADAGMFFKWYGGETQIASLSGTGVFTTTTIVGNTNASTITTGTINNARTSAASANGASTIVARDADGSFTANVVTATTFIGNVGISSGTVNLGRDAYGIAPIVVIDGNMSTTTFAGTITAFPAAGTTSTAASGVGYMGMPRSGAALSGSYTLTASDAGEHIYTTTTRTVTIPGNTTGTGPVAFPIGTTIVFINDTGVTLTLQMQATTTDTCILSGIGTSMTGGSGTRSLAAHGMATLVKVTSTRWYISGNGLS